MLGLPDLSLTGEVPWPPLTSRYRGLLLLRGALGFVAVPWPSRLEANALTYGLGPSCRCILQCRCRCAEVWSYYESIARVPLATLTLISRLRFEKSQPSCQSLSFCFLIGCLRSLSVVSQASPVALYRLGRRNPRRAREAKAADSTSRGCIWHSHAGTTHRGLGAIALRTHLPATGFEQTSMEYTAQELLSSAQNSTYGYMCCVSAAFFTAAALLCVRTLSVLDEAPHHAREAFHWGNLCGSLALGLPHGASA